MKIGMRPDYLISHIISSQNYASQIFCIFYILVSEGYVTYFIFSQTSWKLRAISEIWL